MGFLKHPQIHKDLLSFSCYPSLKLIYCAPLVPLPALWLWQQVPCPAVQSQPHHLLSKIHRGAIQKCFPHFVPLNWPRQSCSVAGLWHWWIKAVSLCIILFSFIENSKIFHQTLHTWQLSMLQTTLENFFLSLGKTNKTTKCPNEWYFCEHL